MKNGSSRISNFIQGVRKSNGSGSVRFFFLLLLLLFFFPRKKYLVPNEEGRKTRLFYGFYSVVNRSVKQIFFMFSELDRYKRK